MADAQEYTNLSLLIRDMAEAGDDQWADEYDDAIAGGATGGEIQARLYGFFSELQQSEIAQRPEFRQRIRDMIAVSHPQHDPFENVIIPVNDPSVVREKALALAKTLHDAGERNWAEGIEYALGHGGLGDVLRRLYSADAGRRLALQPSLLDLYHYNLELPQSSPSTPLLNDTDQFYQRVLQLITDLEMFGEMLAGSDLRQALYGLTGSEVVANIAVQLPRSSIALRPPISEHIRVIGAYLAANMGTRRKRASITLPPPPPLSPYGVRIFTAYDTVAPLIRVLGVSGSQQWGAQLERALYAPLEFGETTGRMSYINFILYRFLEDTNTDSLKWRAQIQAIHRDIVWIRLANGHLTFDWDTEKREIVATPELRDAFATFLIVLRTAGEEVLAKFYQSLLLKKTSGSHPAESENWSTVYSALWSLQREDVAQRLGITHQVGALIEKIAALLTTEAPEG